jgi:hypothetical protein
MRLPCISLLPPAVFVQLVWACHQPAGNLCAIKDPFARSADIAMTPVATSHAVRQLGTPKAPLATSASVAKATRLSGVLKDAFRREEEVFYSLLARILHTHMHLPHTDSSANRDIRDRLDEIQLLISLEIESEGLLRPRPNS